MKNEIIIGKPYLSDGGQLKTFAMMHRLDIKFETPLTERLFYQLENYFIPVYADCNPDQFGRINISGPTARKPIANQGAVVTGCSGGVDSYYSITKHLNMDEGSRDYKLTHLIFMLVSSSHDMAEHEQ